MPSETEVTSAVPPGVSSAIVPRGTKRPRVSFDVVTRLKVRSMYLLQGLQTTEIAEELGLQRSQVQNLISRQKWAQKRKKVAESLEAKAIARTQREVEEIVETVAVKTEELAVRSLDAASEILDDKAGDYWAKDLQSVSQAAKNFVGLARQARGLVSDIEKTDTRPQLVFVQLERIGPRVPKPAPAVEVEARAIAS